MGNVLINSTQIMSRNGVQSGVTKLHYETCSVTGASGNIPTIGTEVMAAYWMIPIIFGGIIRGYNWQVATGSTPPVAGCWKILRLKNNREEWDIAIANTDEIGGVSQWGTYADGLGGSLPSMPVVSLPFPTIQDAPISSVLSGTTTTNTFYFTFPTNPQGLQFNIQCVWFNGVAPGTAYNGTATSPATFVTWANANWSAYGTWTYNGQTVILTSPSTAVTPVTIAGMNAQLVPATYCLALTSFLSGTNVNGIGFGSSGPIAAFGAFQLTGSYASLQQLVTAITPFFDAGATFVILASGTTAKIQITTRLASPIIYNNSTPIAGSTSGGCS